MTAFKNVIYEGVKIKLGLAKANEVIVEGFIGSGGFGDVWEVKDIATGNKYALKHIRLKVNDPEKLANLAMRIQNEASIRIDSPYIVQTYGLAKLGKVDYGILFEYVHGKDLNQWIQENKLLPWYRKKVIFLCILEGVSAAHKQGVVHKDLKPENILITQDDTPKILDFGLAKIKDQNITETGDLGGTLPYMAPEMLAAPREITHQFDIYSLGCILYLMIKGENYCETSNFDMPPFMKMMEQGKLSTGNILIFDSTFSDPDGTVRSAIKKSTTFNPTYRFRDTDEFINHFFPASEKKDTNYGCFIIASVLMSVIACFCVFYFVIILIR